MKDLKQRLINEHIQYEPKNRMDKNECYDYWGKAWNLLKTQGRFEDNEMIQEIFNYLDDNTCTWIIEELNKDHDLGLL